MSKRNKEINDSRRRKIKMAIKNFLSLIKEKNKEEAEKALALVYKELDKAGKRFIHQNKVARLKSKYARKLLKSLGP